MAYNTTSEWEKIENKQFSLIKDLTILAGSVFGLSIALAIGKQGNIRFIVGELLLFISLFSGVIILYASMKGGEFIHFLMTISELKTSLKKRTGAIEDFLVDAQEDLIKSYETLLENNKKGPLPFLLRLIKINQFYSIFIVTFLLGIFFIFFSLVNTTGLEKFILSIKFR